MKKILTLIVILFVGTTKTFATAWNEPWTDKVIKESDSFVLADILSFDTKKGLKIKIEKHLGGEELPKEINITDFYLLELASFSGSPIEESHFEKTGKSYFFIKKSSKGKYCVATPTTGFDGVENGNVSATYRHSYHKALAPADIYEMTMTAIFNHYHQLPYDKKPIEDFIDKQLSQAPAGFGEDEIDTFFLQHTALETIFHLRLDGYYERILPFFNDKTNVHNRVSASRALVSCNTAETRLLLLDRIANNDNDDFATVICIWTLQEFKPTELKPELNKLTKKASTEENGFGGNIMGPRVATQFPNVKAALESLIKTL